MTRAHQRLGYCSKGYRELERFSLSTVARQFWYKVSKMFLILSSFSFENAAHLETFFWIENTWRQGHAGSNSISVVL